MHKGRLEAFSDGVIAIIITIMVLEMKVPHGTDFAALAGLAPVLLSYVLSFVYVGIYWNNHHHMLHAVQRVNGLTLWANLHLLFWLSLVPFVTGWLGENGLATLPVVLYGVVLLGAAIAYAILAATLKRLHGPGSTLAQAIGLDVKGWGSIGLYLLAIGLYLLAIGAAFVWQPLSLALYVAVAIIWLVPDRRIERALGSPEA